MLTVKAKIPQQANYSPILPVVIPDLGEVKAFADHLHSTGKHWEGEIFGWPAEYTPESRKKPLESKMRFTPADFWIGESGIWFYSLMWERGKNKEPIEFLDDRGVVKQQWQDRPTLRVAAALRAPIATAPGKTKPRAIRKPKIAKKERA